MSHRRTELLLFTAAFLAFAWFHQGGGWNQNARFAEVRAIVEQGRFAIDDFFVYRDTGQGRFIRLPVENGDVTVDGVRRRLAWADGNWNLTPINGLPPGDGVAPVALEEVACSGDVSFVGGHFHPNKPPGSTLLAVPPYFLIHLVQRLAGIDPDGWWALTCNGWLTSVLSVGLISAAGCVIFFRMAKRLGANEKPALVSAVAFGFGTLWFPYATMLFDHNLCAVALLAGFAALARRPELPPAMLDVVVAGLCAGMAALTNYVAAAAGVILAIYLLARVRSEGPGGMVRAMTAYSVGVAGPMLLLAGYGAACYGSPFVLSTDFQNPLFKDQPGAFLGMFGWPRPDVPLGLLISPFRGLFYGAPVLLLALWGWTRLRKTHAAEAWLIAAMFGLFFVVNATFFGWHSGFAVGPRYLIPALPFLALALVPAAVVLPRLTAALAAVSVAINLLFTAVDAESPLGVGGHARVGDRWMWFYDQVREYALPLFATGRAWPVLEGVLDLHLAEEREKLAEAGHGKEEREEKLAALRRELVGAIERGDSEPFMLAAFHGPVSVNPIGMYEGEYLRFFGAHAPETQWNSFNAGELIFPGSRWSLAPLLAAGTLLLGTAFRRALN